MAAVCSIYHFLCSNGIILVSKHFSKFAQIIGRRNPVATLATLILLSYAKLLNTIIVTLSFAILNYPDGSHQIVWLPDANVGYLSGKHIPLFIVAILILLSGVAYTTVLFSWQWLLRLQYQWTQYHKLQLFLEAYHAPYTFRHRYWTGLLLPMRVVVYIISAVNVTRDQGINLPAVIIAMVSLLLVQLLLRKADYIYRKWLVEILEVISYINISAFCLIKLYTS